MFCLMMRRAMALILRAERSFPADSAPEDVAERLLTSLSPYAYIERDKKTTWSELRKELLSNSNAARHTQTVAEQMDYERGALSRVIPRYSKDLR